MRDIGRLASFLGRSPDTATFDDLHRFQMAQQEAGLGVPTMNAIVSALRFFFVHTIDRPDLARKLVRLRYNSCRNRHCPRCQGAAARDWLAEREADLLPVGYFHVVFTLPAEIATIAFQNKAAVYNLLFKAAAETMTKISADPKHLGARIGLTAVLHTWGSAMPAALLGVVRAQGSLKIASRPQGFVTR